MRRERTDSFSRDGRRIHDDDLIRGIWFDTIIVGRAYYKDGEWCLWNSKTNECPRLMDIDDMEILTEEINE